MGIGNSIEMPKYDCRTKLELQFSLARNPIMEKVVAHILLAMKALLQTICYDGRIFNVIADKK